MIAAVRDDPWLLNASRCYRPGVAFGLRTRVGEIQILNALHLHVQPRKRVTHHIGTVRATGELLSAEKIVPPVT